MTVTPGERAELDQRDALIDDLVSEVTQAVAVAKATGVESAAYVGGLLLARRVQEIPRRELPVVLCHALARLAQARIGAC